MICKLPPLLALQLCPLCDILCADERRRFATFAVGVPYDETENVGPVPRFPRSIGWTAKEWEHDDFAADDIRCRGANVVDFRQDNPKTPRIFIQRCPRLLGRGQSIPRRRNHVRNVCTQSCTSRLTPSGNVGASVFPGQHVSRRGQVFGDE